MTWNRCWCWRHSASTCRYVPQRTFASLWLWERPSIRCSIRSQRYELALKEGTGSDESPTSGIRMNPNSANWLTSESDGDDDGDEKT